VALLEGIPDSHARIFRRAVDGEPIVVEIS
jgi:hypothetical protein